MLGGRWSGGAKLLCSPQMEREQSNFHASCVKIYRATRNSTQVRGEISRTSQVRWTNSISRRNERTGVWGTPGERRPAPASHPTLARCLHDFSLAPVKLITLTTDFGLGDWFVGTMKGVILRISPGCQIVDITHEIPAGDVRTGAFALAAACRYFPRGTVHVAVVDPGVGSKRPVIGVQTGDYQFVGPDNGVLSLALTGQKIKAIRRVENESLFVQPVSQTFHGRDVLAPVAAHLSEGASFRSVGPVVKECVRLEWPEPEVDRSILRGQVIYLDRFGNAITNITGEHLAMLTGSVWSVRLLRGRRFPVVPFYQAVPAGQPAGILGSSGFLEIAVNRGSAAEVLRLKLGDAVMICPAKQAIQRLA